MIDFNTLLTADQKRDLLTQRIQQFAAEAYQHDLNRQVSEKVGDVASAQQSQAALDALASAIEIHQAELDSLSE